MTEVQDFELSESGTLTKEMRSLGFNRFRALAEHVRHLPYGRPSDANAPAAVLKEGRGTCSSKHRLLAMVAHECGQSQVELVVGLYAMSELNTPGVGPVLAAAGFASIPEAHCYLRFAGQRHDFTGLGSGESSPFEALQSEHAVLPARLTEEKARLHEQAMRAWATANALSFEDAWALRERCILSLAVPSTGVRAATVEDAADACDVLRRSIAEACTLDHGNDERLVAAWLANKTPANVASWMQAPGAIPVVAQRAGEIVGFALAHGDQLKLCYVAPDMLRQGVGKLLLAEVISQARAHGLSRLRLESTLTAYPFYLRNGFVPSVEAQAVGGTKSRPMVIGIAAP